MKDSNREHNEYIFVIMKLQLEEQRISFIMT